MRRIEECAVNLVKHGFEVKIVTSLEEAKQIIRDEIKQRSPQRVSYGDSITIRQTGLVEEFKTQNDFIFFDGFDRTITREERIEQKRQAILTDVFFTGVNAISITGSLFWRDMVGNRVAPVAFGPKRVIIVAGKNKIVETAEEAIERIKEIAAPLNALRHPGFNTPCIKTGKCMDCNSPHRICNISLTMDRCFPKNRMLVVLVDEVLGY